MTTAQEIAFLVASITRTDVHVRRATRRKLEIVLGARDRREDELADKLDRAECALRRLTR